MRFSLLVERAEFWSEAEVVFRLLPAALEPAVEALPEVVDLLPDCWRFVSESMAEAELPGAGVPAAPADIGAEEIFLLEFEFWLEPLLG